MKIGVLALQGDFIEHIKILQKLGIETVEIRQKKDLTDDIKGLILPGGESTTMGKLLYELKLMNPIKEKILNGMPVFGTCAGLILLCENIEGENKGYLKVLPATVRRNAYGRQLGSFIYNGEFKGVGTVKMNFIRAPFVVEANEDVEILGKVNGKIVACKYGNILGISFHPEVTEDTRIHKYFIDIINKNIYSHN